MTAHDAPRGRDRIIVAALVSGATRAEAAEQAGCSTATVDRCHARWRDLITEQRDEVAERVAASMLALVPEAVAAYADLVRSTVPGIRLAAARDVVGHALRWRDQTEVERRLSELEAAAPRRPWEAA